MNTRVRLLSFAVVVAGLMTSAATAQDKSPDAEQEVIPATKAPKRPAGPVADEEASSSRGYPVLKLERTGAASEVIRTARQVQNEAKCDRCGGDGEKVIEEVKYPRTNPRSNVPFKEGKKVTRKERCEKCGASGLSAEKMFEVAMDNLARAIAAVKEDDARVHEAMDKATEHLQAAFAGKAWGGAARSFGELTRRRTNDKPLKIGTPIYFVGFLMDDPAAAEGRPLRISTISLGGRVPAEEVFWVTDPVLSRAAKGERVVVGGMFAGRQTVNANKSVPVAQGGWVVVVK